MNTEELLEHMGRCVIMIATLKAPTPWVPKFQSVIPRWRDFSSFDDTIIGRDTATGFPFSQPSEGRTRFLMRLYYGSDDYRAGILRRLFGGSGNGGDK